MTNARPSALQRGLPTVLSPSELGTTDLVAGVRNCEPQVTSALRERGGLLFRDFDLLGASGLERLIQAVSGQAMEYTDRAARRTQIEGRIYTAADYPAAQEIFLHNESAYAARWPMKIFLHCRCPAETGGHTPLADVRRVFERIDPAIRRDFADKGVLYVRNFGNGVFSPTWQEAFQTEDRLAMEAHCRAADIDFEWIQDEHLRTRQRRSAIAQHPLGGESVWFNHAATLHISTLAPRVRKRIERLFTPENLPANTYLGDGSPIEEEVLDHIRDAYRQESVRFDWQRGDVLLLDNMLVAHGREPFSGPRDVMVGMSEAMSWQELEGGDGGV